MHRHFRVLPVLCLALASFFSHPASAADIKFAILAPKGSTFVNGVEGWCKDVTAKTAGGVKCTIFDSGQQGDEKVVNQKMKIGQLQGGAFSGLGLGLACPAARVLELPMLFKNYAEVDYVKEKIRPALEKCFDDRGFVLVGFAEAGFVNMFSNKPISSTKDLKGIKMWVWADDELAKVLAETYNVSPIPLGVVDVLTMLQTGQIDAVYGPPIWVIASQWHTKVKYMTDLKIINSTGAILVSKKFFSTLTPAQQQILKTSGNTYGNQLVTAIRADNEKSYQVLKQMGIQFIKPSAADEANLKTLSEGAYTNPKLLGKFYDQAMLDQVQGLLKDYRTQHAAN